MATHLRLELDSRSTSFLSSKIVQKQAQPAADNKTEEDKVMFKKFKLSALVLIAASAGLAVSVQTVTGNGGAHALEAIAKISAEKYVHQRCRQMGGSVEWDSTILHSCQYYSGHHGYVCTASCGCKIP
jgi:hypothetical protein